MLRRLVPVLLRQRVLPFVPRFASSDSTDKSRVRLHPGNQFSVEEIAQGLPEQRKQEIEQLYEFEKLEINEPTSLRDEYRHHVNRE